MAKGERKTRAASAAEPPAKAPLEKSKCGREESWCDRLGLAKPKLLSFEEVGAWEQDNEFIHKHYRPAFGSRLKCLGSWCYLHNQTGNIFTHGLSFFVFLYLLVDLAASVYDRAGCISDALSILPLSIGCLGVFTFSTFFHTFRCNSEHDCDHFNKLDYSGIVLSTWGAISTMVINAFRCNAKLMLLYLGSSTVTAALVVLVILKDSFADTKYRPLRPLPFALQMLVGIAPFVHISYVASAEAAQDVVEDVIALVSCFFIGAIIFTSRVPERFFPGKFDLIFQSHQIFHCFVTAGMYFTYRAAVASTQWGTVLSNCGVQHHECIAGF